MRTPWGSRGSRQPMEPGESPSSGSPSPVASGLSFLGGFLPSFFGQDVCCQTSRACVQPCSFQEKDVVPDFEVFQCGGGDVSRTLWERAVTVVQGLRGHWGSAGALLRPAGAPAANLERSGRPSWARPRPALRRVGGLCRCLRLDPQAQQRCCLHIRAEEGWEVGAAAETGFRRA